MKYYLPGNEMYPYGLILHIFFFIFMRFIKDPCIIFRINIVYTFLSTNTHHFYDWCHLIVFLST